MINERKFHASLYLEKCSVFASRYNTLLGEIYQKWNQLQRLDILLNLSCNLSTYKIVHLNNIKSKLRTLAKDKYTFDEKKITYVFFNKKISSFCTAFYS